MKRREFITLIGGAAAAWPLAARAQQPDQMRRIGVLMTSKDDRDTQAHLGMFRQTLRELGWTEGSNVRIDIRWGEGEASRASAFAVELIGMSPDVILASSPSAVSELLKETGTIPIVFAQVPDPVGLGLVASLARPGGNVTGFMHFEPAMGGKWLALLKEIAPRVRRVALLQNPEHPAWLGFLRTIRAAAPSFGVEVIPARLRLRSRSHWRHECHNQAAVRLTREHARSSRIRCGGSACSVRLPT